jgi:two-component sensor histidine kinase
MSALTELLAARTTLDDERIDHLQRLVSEWQLLSDLSFADLLLWVPVAGTSSSEDGATFLCVAQCRPTTGPTAYLTDEVGSTETMPRSRPLQTAYSEGRIFREAEADWEGDLPVRREAIPVRLHGEVIAVVGRDSNLASVRTPSQLELVYLASAADLAAMIGDGSFPGAEGSLEEGAGPRVGDGLLRLEPDGTIVYASPNALSAFSRLGITGTVLSEPIGALTSSVADDPFDARDLATAVGKAIEGGQSANIEVEAGAATVLFRAIPLRPGGETLGALVLMQDVTELRRRDRQILSKEATIREIHHRVKNNLQTVAALLRLQARRVDAPEAKLALEESMRRVTSIALVHETLSTSIDESVAFDEVVDRLLGMLSDVMGSAGQVNLRRAGTFGDVPAETATALVLVLTELVQNSLEHGFPDGRDGSVRVSAERGRNELVVTISDDGVGLPEDFDAGASERLGLQIVKTLVSAELSGEVEFRRGQHGGAVAVLSVPLGRRPRATSG